MLFGILIGAVVVVAAVELLARRGAARRLALPAAWLLAIGIVGWNLWGEIAAANASNTMADAFRSVLPTPPDWIDRATGTRPHDVHRPVARRLERILVARVLEPVAHLCLVGRRVGAWAGLVTTPNFRDTTGHARARSCRSTTSSPGRASTRSACSSNSPSAGSACTGFAIPIRLADAQGGITPDGWMESSAWYYHFAPRRPRPGVASVSISRAAACGSFAPSHITIRASRLRIDENGQPAAGPSPCRPPRHDPLESLRDARW